MPSIYQLKPAFQRFLRPCVQRLYDRGITANQVTLLAAGGSLLVGTLIALLATYIWIFLLVPAWMLARMALNAIDGMLAREFQQKSDLGAYLNELCDVIADSALILPFLVISDVSWALVLLATLLALLCEYAGAMSPMIGASRRYDGPMGKSDRAFVFGVAAIGIALGWLDTIWLNLLLALTCILLLFTLINRVRQGLNEAKKYSHTE
ncbi:CDP-alcohol phosphatidyltransferase family protein [Pseudomonas sp. NPDC088444]|uniref:CDP-alcohol phosphatidyltransferase family protein n=1 Tax=Pseudomonas sp. NPDC088444 TaxID=3364456 RepID=UPI00384F0DCE